MEYLIYYYAGAKGRDLILSINYLNSVTVCPAPVILANTGNFPSGSFKLKFMLPK